MRLDPRILAGLLLLVPALDAQQAAARPQLRGRARGPGRRSPPKVRVTDLAVRMKVRTSITKVVMTATLHNPAATEQEFDLIFPLGNGTVVANSVPKIGAITSALIPEEPQRELEYQRRQSYSPPDSLSSVSMSRPLE